MRRIGTVDTALATPEWKIIDEGMLAPAPLMISDSLRDGVSVLEKYEQIGWILPADETAQGGGKIYETKEHAGANGVACYVKRATEAPQPAPDDTRARVEALEKAFVLLTSQSADIIEAQRASIATLQRQIREAFDYSKSLEQLMRGVTRSGTEISLRRQAALAALPSVLLASDTRVDPEHAAKVAFVIADAMIAADAPTTDQAHRD